MQKYFTQKYYSGKRKDTSSKTKALLALAWVSVLWGTTWLASKEGVRHMPALQMAGIRQSITGIIYVLFFIIKKQPFPKGKQWLVILILSFLNFMIGNGLSTWGVKYISSGLGSIISAIFPLWLVIIMMFAGKRLPLKALAGLLLGFGGICIIFYEHLKDLLNADFRFGIFISIIATIGWAFGTLFTKQQASNFNPYFSLGFQMLISGITFSIISYASGNVISISQIPAASWWSIAYLVVFGSGITFIAYVYSLQHLPAALASVYAYVNPVIAVLLGAAILHEKLSILIAAGGIITFTGVYLINNSLNKKIILTPEKIKK